MATTTQHHKTQNHALILLAPGFEEGPTVYCLDRLRSAGIRVHLVGIVSGMVRGLHGITIQTDYSLNQLPPALSFSLIVIPDGKECVSTLLSDPRTHQLMNEIARDQGIIAVMPGAEASFRQVSILTDANEGRFVLQRDKTLDSFTSELVNRFVAKVL